MPIVQQYAVQARGIGLPDYSQPQPLGTVPIGPVHTLTDLGELAARLKSPVTFDRRGNVMWMDDFEDGVDKWTWSYDVWPPGGATLTWTALVSNTGSFSAMLKTPNVEGKYTSMRHDAPYTVPSNVGFEVSISYLQYWETLYLGLYAQDYEQNYWSASIKFNPIEEKVYYSDAAGNWHDTGLRFYVTADSRFFFPYKLVIDSVRKEYKRLVLSGQSLDLSGIPLASGITPGPARIRTSIKLITDRDDNAIAYIDNVIITQNEPPDL